MAVDVVLGKAFRDGREIMMNSTMTNKFGGVVGGEAVDALYVIFSTITIFTMQTGFGLLESGLVSRKSESNVMVKNMLDVVVGGAGFWLIGYGISFGPNEGSTGSFIGNGHFFINVPLEDAHVFAKYLFHMAFATTATTIVSGAVAERIQLSSYVIFIFIQTSVSYSLPAHWMWAEHGWLIKRGAFDFAGATVVHMTGGTASFVAAMLLGPRHGRFGYEKEPYKMANPSNVVTGTFFLWWGWIAFNAGSTFSLTGNRWQLALRAAVVTMGGAMSGGLSGIALSLWLFRKRRYMLDIPQFTTSILGGLVAVTGCAAVIKPWESMAIGFIGGSLANIAVSGVKKLNIDDPVGCVGIHWAVGFWSMIATGLFAEQPKGFNIISESGIFYGGSGNMLAYNIAACISITMWSASITLILFLTMKATIGIRMTLENEMRGSDEVEHNVFEHVVKVETKNVFQKNRQNKSASAGNENPAAQLSSDVI